MLLHLMGVYNSSLWQRCLPIWFKTSALKDNSHLFKLFLKEENTLKLVCLFAPFPVLNVYKNLHSLVCLECFIGSPQ